MKPKPPHHNAFRFMLPRSTALADPVTAKLASSLGICDIWYGADRKLVLYPTDDNALWNFVAVHPASLSSASTGYKTSGSKEVMLELYKDFDLIARALLSHAPEDTLKVYQLQDMDALPTFVHDRLALAGDAAHPFLPHLGQGGAQAIEDGVSLGVLLSSDITRKEVPSRLKLYNHCRYERATLIQHYTRLAGGDGLSDNQDAAETEQPPGELIVVACLCLCRADRCAVNVYFGYAFSHDEYDASSDRLREYKENKSVENQLSH